MSPRDMVSAPPQAGESHASASDKEVLVELIGLHARVLQRMPWVQSLLVLGMALFVVAHVETAAFLAWGLLTVGVEALRAIYARRIVAQGSGIDPAREHRRFVVLAGAAGAAVGVGAIAFLPRLPMNDQALFGAILFAMPAAGVAVSQSSRYMLAAYALAMLLPASLTWMWLHESQAVAVFALTLLYCALIITVAADGDKLLLRSVLIRHERDLLVRDLQARNAQVRAAMDEVEQSARARERVLAAASHDLRQPLHALSIYSAVLAADPTPATQREVAASIDQIVRSLGALLNGMLDLSRLSTGLYVPDIRRFALDELVATVCAEYEGAAAVRGLELHKRLAPIALASDPVVMARIVRNLVDNAIKYTERGGILVSISLETESGAATAVIAVRDSGRGIPASEHARIFEEFYQVDNPGRDRSRGVGLGLAIVRRLCDIAGAQISLRSEPGLGSVFEVRLRADDNTETALEQSPRPASAVPAFQARSIYVIDDEAEVLESTARLLQMWGMRTMLASSSEDAERVFEQHGPPDLMLTDLRLGGTEDGAELAQRMQARYGTFQVLILTGEVSAAAAQRIERFGYPMLRKPVTAESLRERMDALLAASDAV